MVIVGRKILRGCFFFRLFRAEGSVYPRNVKIRSDYVISVNPVDFGVQTSASPPIGVLNVYFRIFLFQRRNNVTEKFFTKKKKR